ncbi:hypothetical protein [Pseudescherichia sp.]|uniref:hypothetical protein n=1 Tax=Pseudescherichia sp. TaxID=2055881 RepID=UPI0028A96D93|nr:hypothetical protein [Pseudescherichia sp.]
MQKGELNYTGKRLRTAVKCSFLYGAVKVKLDEGNLTIFVAKLKKNESYGVLTLKSVRNG